MNIISDSRAQRWNLCARKCYWHDVRGLRLERHSTPMIRGLAIHAGLAEWYKTNSEQSSLVALNKEFDNMLPEDRRCKLMQVELDEYERERLYCNDLLLLYTKRYAQETFKPLQVETDFTVSLREDCYCCGGTYSKDVSLVLPDVNKRACMQCGSPIYYLTGRVDLIAATGPQDMLDVDHKTMRGASDSTMDAFEHSYQQIGYVYAMSRIAPEYPVRGYMINVIKTLKTLDKRGDPFMRKTFHFQAIDFDKFIDNRLGLLMVINTEIQQFNNAGLERRVLFPMNDRACHYGSPCEFIPLCWDSPTTEWWDPPKILLDEYTQKNTDLIVEEVNNG